MSTRDVNLYGIFEDWFLANMDADSAHALREHGASYGIDSKKTPQPKTLNGDTK